MLCIKISLVKIYPNMFFFRKSKVVNCASKDKVHLSEFGNFTLQKKGKNNQDTMFTCYLISLFAYVD